MKMFEFCDNMGEHAGSPLQRLRINFAALFLDLFFTLFLLRKMRDGGQAGGEI
jgi:hypothetical protein